MDGYPLREEMEGYLLISGSVHHLLGIFTPRTLYRTVTQMQSVPVLRSREWEHVMTREEHKGKPRLGRDLLGRFQSAWRTGIANA